MNSIIFGGGCFWCTEAVFRSLKGVIAVTPGYAGGEKPNPSYEEVCMGKTGHAEVVKVDYDPDQINLTDLLTVFFATHDPTTPNRQGADVGTQYRSAIYFTDKDQEPIIQRFIVDLNSSAVDGASIVTEVKPVDDFWPAEADHQQYYERNPQSMYCSVVINPKLQKVQEKFADLLRSHG